MQHGEIINESYKNYKSLSKEERDKINDEFNKTFGSKVFKFKNIDDILFVYEPNYYTPSLDVVDGFLKVFIPKDLEASFKDSGGWVFMRKLLGSLLGHLVSKPASNKETFVDIADKEILHIPEDKTTRDCKEYLCCFSTHMHMFLSIFDYKDMLDHMDEIEFICQYE